MSTLAAQKETTKRVLDAYKAWDLEQIMAFRAPNCRQRVIPASMGRPWTSNDEYREGLTRIMPLFRNWTITVDTEVHDAEQHTCMMHATSSAETDIGPYLNEYALILHFTDDGKQVIKILEMVDSAYSLKFFADIAAAVRK
ncbi:hypothetical protein ACEQ8H_004802 [Pleosporales sp. CAS-2024a]